MGFVNKNLLVARKISSPLRIQEPEISLSSSFVELKRISIVEEREREREREREMKRFSRSYVGVVAKTQRQRYMSPFKLQKIDVVSVKRIQIKHLVG